MNPLRVVVLLFSTLIITLSVDNKIQCSSRPPPEVNVVPFKPQPPASYKKCDASTHACYYFRYHGSRVSRDFPVHGCSQFEKLPPPCRSGGSHYEPNWAIQYRGATYQGSIKCCGNDYCNELEEAMFVPVHFNHDEAGFFKEYIIFPILLTFFVALIFSEHLPDFTYEIRRFFGLEQILDGSDQQEALSMSSPDQDIFPDQGGPTQGDGILLPYTGPNITGFFTSIRNMLEVIREIEKWRPEVEAEKEREAKREERRGKGGARKGKQGREVYAKELIFNKCISNRQSSEHNDAKVPTRLTDLVARLIEHGPYEFPFDPNELGDLFDKASEVVGDEPSVIDVDFGVHIIGNLEGSYINLFRWFYIFGWPPKEKFIFLGGAIHSENPFSLEVLALILALKMKMPNQIYLIRGSAEGQPLNMGDRFPPRVCESLREVAAKVLSRLPLAVLINKQILCIHSSLPNGMTTVEEINQIRRPLTAYHKESLEAYLLNAIPDTVLHRPKEELTDNPRAFVDEIIDGYIKKGSLMFLPKDLDDTLRRLKLDMIIRAKSVCKFGVSALTDRIISLWSTQYFGGTEAGAAMMIDTNGSLSITRLYKFGSFNQDPSPVAHTLLENTITEELERVETSKRGQDALDALNQEPKVHKMGFYV